MEFSFMEQPLRSVHSESHRPQGHPYGPEVWYSLVMRMQMATCLTPRKPRQRIRSRKNPEGLPGSSGRGMCEEMQTRTWETFQAPAWLWLPDKRRAGKPS